MAELTKMTQFVSKVLDELQQKFPGRVDAERVRGIDGYYYHLAVTSDRFKRMDRWRRDEAVWDVVKSRVGCGEERRQ